MAAGGPLSWFDLSRNRFCDRGRAQPMCSVKDKPPPTERRVAKGNLVAHSGTATKVRTKISIKSIATVKAAAHRRGGPREVPRGPTGARADGGEHDRRAIGGNRRQTGAGKAKEVSHWLDWSDWPRWASCWHWLAFMCTGRPVASGAPPQPFQVAKDGPCFVPASQEPSSSLCSSRSVRRS